MAQQKRLGKRATTVHAENGTTVVTYHSTPIVTFDGKRVILNTGGWFTATTKTRMNQAACQFGLPYSVHQEKFRWFVDTPEGTKEFKENICSFIEVREEAQDAE